MQERWPGLEWVPKVPTFGLRTMLRVMGSLVLHYARSRERLHLGLMCWGAEGQTVHNYTTLGISWTEFLALVPSKGGGGTWIGMVAYGKGVTLAHALFL